MAWIESHQELPRHPKTKRLARALALKDAALAHHVAVSVLHHLWWWALDFAENGDLTPFTAEDIADACRWPTAKADALVDALVASGWLDRDGDHLSVHDYAKRLEPLIRRREQNKERARASRERYALRHANGARDVSVTCGATGTGTGTGTFRPPLRAPHAEAEAARKAAAKRDLDAALAMANYIDPIDPTLPADPPDA